MKNKIINAVLVFLICVSVLSVWSYYHSEKSIREHRYIMPPTPRTTVPNASATPLQYHPSPTPTIGPVMAAQ